MRRVYVGRLGHHVRERDVEKFFRSEGKIREVLMKDGFAFVEFDHTEDAEAAIRHLNGRDINGDRVHVEFAKGPSRGGFGGSRDLVRDSGREYGRDSGRDIGNDSGRDLGRSMSRNHPRDMQRDIGRGGRGDMGNNNLSRDPISRNRPSSSSSSINRNIGRNDRYDYNDRNDRNDRNRDRGDYYGSGGRSGGISYAEKYGPPRNTDYRVIVENLSSRVSWQDLKDLMRQAGEVTFADAHKRGRNMGIVDFASLKDMRHAVEAFNDTEFHGRRIRVLEDKSRRHDDDSSGESRSGDSRSGESRSNSPNSKKPRSDSPDSKKLRSDSPNSRNLRSDSQDSKRPRFDSPDSKKPKSDSPDSKKHRFDSPDSKKRRSNSPDSKKRRSETPDSEKNRSDSSDSKKPRLSSSPNSQKSED